MRIKRMFLALIIAGILIASSVLVFLVYQSVQDERIAYVGIRMDKDVFHYGENITFDLVSLTDGADFNITDPGNANEYAENYGGVNIYRIPDLIDVDDLLKDPVYIHYLSETIYMHDDRLAKIHYEFFDSNAEPLELAWNGTIKVYDFITHKYSYSPATSGNYMIVPDLQSGDIQHLVFLLDESAIFYYDSLDTGLQITNIPDTNVNVNMALRAPQGTVGDLNCDLFTIFHYLEEGSNDPFHYYNRTGLVLISDREENLNFTFDIAIPDHGTEYDDGTASFTSVIFSALLVTPSGNFTFGFSGYWNGGWEDLRQY